MSDVAIALQDLTDVLDEMTWNNLYESQPALAAAIVRAVSQNVTPEAISRHVLANQGSFETAKKCRAAARHILKGVNREP